MTTWRKLSEEKVRRIVRQYEAGDSLTLLANRYGVTRECVSYHVRRRSPVRRQIQKVTDESRAEFLKRWKRGETAAEIAKKFGLGERTVSHHLREMTGKSLRPRRTMSLVLPDDPVAVSYLAAMFDAEGCLSLVRGGGRSLDHWQLTITNSSLALKKWLEPCRGNFYYHPRQKRTGGKKGYRKQVWMWKVTSDIDVLAFLEKVLPYLVIKKGRAVEVVAILRERAGEVPLLRMGEESPR